MKLLVLQKSLMLLLLSTILMKFSHAQLKLNVKADSIFVAAPGGQTLFGVDNTGRVKIDSTADGSGDNYVLTWDPATKKVKKVLKSSIGGGSLSLQQATDVGNTTTNNIVISRSAANATVVSSVTNTSSSGSGYLASYSNAGNLVLQSNGTALLGGGIAQNPSGQQSITATNSLYFKATDFRFYDGRVGINTGNVTPAYTLDVNGAARITDTLRLMSTKTGSSFDNILVKNATTKAVMVIPQTEGPVVLAKGTVTNSATLDLNMSAYYNLYDIIEIKYHSARPVKNAALLLCRFSADASTYATSGYKWNIMAAVGSSMAGVDDVSASNTASIQIAGACSNITERTVSGTITINNSGVRTFFPMVQFTSSRYNNTPAVSINHGTGLLTTAQITKAIRLYFSTGNISNLSYKVIGYKN